MNDLLIHPGAKQQLDAIAAEPPHAVAILGSSGMGKKTVAQALAHQLAQTEPELLEPDDKGSISIEAVRALYRSTRSKRTERQVVVIDHAECMGHEAQNALLKLLEEPRAGVTFILTAPHTEALLPTILSRVQQLNLQPIAAATLRQFIHQRAPDMPAATVAQVMFAAQGRPGVAVALLQDSAALQHMREIMQQAKELMGFSRYQKLARITMLAKDRPQCIQVLEALLHMTSLQLVKANSTKVGQWVNLSNNLQTVLQRLQQNGNLKAQLLWLFTRP